MCIKNKKKLKVFCIYIKKIKIRDLYKIYLLYFILNLKIYYYHNRKF